MLKIDSDRFLWGAWWAGTIVIVLSWVDVVPPVVGWVGFGIAAIAAFVSVVVNRAWKPPASGVGQSGSASTVALEVGGLYAVPRKDGPYSVVKVLAEDQSAYHLRVYSNTFPEVPNSSVIPELALGNMDGEAAFGVGHLPVPKDGMDTAKYIQIATTDVTNDELEGYRIWLAQ
jgi:hypothetical protein